VSLFVVDASVAVKWILPEEHSDAARELLAGEHELIAPPLISTEIAHVLLKSVRRKELTRARAANALAQIERWLQTLEFEGAWGRLFSLAERCQISAYDANYVALALELDVRLITADQRLVRALGVVLPRVAVWIADLASLDADEGTE
jgi:predicted nucleic acid-binding protein